MEEQIQTLLSEKTVNLEDLINIFLLFSCNSVNLCIFSRIYFEKESFFTCEQLIQRQQRKDFLHHIVTEDEKWIFYDNPKKKKYYAKSGQSLPSISTSTSRPNIHGSKIMLCIWWDQKSLVYYELLKPGNSITGDRY